MIKIGAIHCLVRLTLKPMLPLFDWQITSALVHVEFVVVLIFLVLVKMSHRPSTSAKLSLKFFPQTPLTLI
jgi:hypothetical protein